LRQGNPPGRWPGRFASSCYDLFSHRRFCRCAVPSFLPNCHARRRASPRAQTLSQRQVDHQRLEFRRESRTRPTPPNHPRSAEYLRAHENQINQYFLTRKSFADLLIGSVHTPLVVTSVQVLTGIRFVAHCSVPPPIQLKLILPPSRLNLSVVPRRVT